MRIRPLCYAGVLGSVSEDHASRAIRQARCSPEEAGLCEYDTLRSLRIAVLPRRPGSCSPRLSGRRRGVPTRRPPRSSSRRERASCARRTYSAAMHSGWLDPCALRTFDATGGPCSSRAACTVYGTVRVGRTKSGEQERVPPRPVPPRVERPSVPP